MLVPFLRETRTVGRDGYVQWERGWYGVSWTHAGQVVEIQAAAETVQLWAGTERLAVQPRATRPGQSDAARPAALLGPEGEQVVLVAAARFGDDGWEGYRWQAM